MRSSSRADTQVRKPGKEGSSATGKRCNRMLLTALAALLACGVLSPAAGASQLVGTGVQRIFAPSNDNLDIDEKDDQRVDVDVAIMDFGIDLDHPDLNVVGGLDCLDADSVAECEENTPNLSGDEGDPGEEGHGTRLAGTTGALDNGFGIVGVAPGARLWSVVTRDPEFNEAKGTRFDVDVAIAAIEWVMQHNEEHPDEDIEVVGLGLVCELVEPAPPTPPLCIGDAGPEELEEVLEEAISMGIVFVTGPGNSNIDAGELFPQSFPEMIVPSFMNDFDGLPGAKKAPPFCNGVSYPEYTPMIYDDTKSSNSNWGEVLDLTVPGFCIASTETGGGYNLGGAGSAGSAATPHVIGAAAVLASMHDPQDAEDVEEIGEALYGDSDCAVNPPDEGPDVGTGNCGWTDTSEDGIQEPLLDVGDEEVFDPVMAPGPEPFPVDADVNGDNRADLVALRANGVAYVHPGGADSKFGTGVSSFSGSPLNVAQYDGSGHYAIDVADVNGDKRADLITLTDDGDVHVYRGKADSTFDSGVTSELGLTPGLLEPGGHEPIAVADVNGDSYADLVAHDDSTDQVMDYLGDSQGAFAEGAVARSGVSSALHTGIGHHFIDLGDVTGDNRADLVSLSSTGDLNVFPGQNGGAFGTPIVSHEGEIDPAMDDGSGYEPIGLGDVTGDRRADLALLKAGTAYVYPALGDPDSGELGTAKTSLGGALTSTTFDPAAVAEVFGLYDVDGNGRADLVGTNAKQSTVGVLPGGSDGSLGSAIASSGTFPSTQHFKNQTSSGNEFVLEKPSWRRRGCLPKGCGWVIEPVIDAEGGNNQLTDVSCTAASFCFATGYLNGSWAFGRVWDGSAWAKTGGIPENGGTELSGVSCVSASWCMAVGSKTAGSEVKDFAARWNGTEWISTSTAGLNAGKPPNDRLTDVSCTSSSFCFATAYLTSGGTTWAYGATWDGSSWTHRGGVPENKGTKLSGVSCTSSSACTAVGSKTIGSEVKTFAMRWDGKWSLQEVPNAQGGNNHLTDVSCTSSSFCHATGYLVTSGTLAYGRVWNGSTWTTTGGVPPGENSGVLLNGISCTSATSCTAVGTKTTEGDDTTFAAHWDGSKWRRQATPNAAEADHSRLAGVSCAASSCTAVGQADEKEDSNLAMRLP